MKRLLYFLLILSVLASCTDETKVQSVRLTPDTLALFPGQDSIVLMSIFPLTAAAHNPTAWETSDPNVAVVSPNGTVTAVYTGECVITGKAMHKEGYCKVYVLPLVFNNIKLEKFVIFDNGELEGKDARNYLLRLHESTLSFDSVGHATGDGFFLNISLCAKNIRFIPDGTYVINNDSAAFSIMPGQIKKEEDASYAVGSYIGFYNANGLSVVFLKEGSLQLLIDDKYHLSYEFKGEKGEIIKQKFEGIPIFYNADIETSEIKLNYTSVKESNVTIDDEKLCGHSKIQFNVSDTVIEFIARHPKSISTTAQGVYRIDSDQKYFTLMAPDNSNFCKMISNKDTTSITKADLRINIDSEGIKHYDASFVDQKGNSYILQPNAIKNIPIMLKIKDVF